MITVTHARFYQDGRLVSPGEDSADIATRGYTKYSILDQGDNKIRVSMAENLELDGSYLLLHTSGHAASAWDYIGPPIEIAWKISSFIDPFGGTYFLGSIVGGQWQKSKVGFAEEILGSREAAEAYTYGGQVLNAPETFNQIIQGFNWVASFGRDSYDRALGTRSELRIDKSAPYDRIDLEFKVDTWRGDPIGWVRTAPVPPGGTLSSVHGPVIQVSEVEYADHVDDKPHSGKVIVSLFPKNMPDSGSFNLQFSTKETDCWGCLSVLSSMKVDVHRSCLAEGLSRTSGTGCQTCSYRERSTGFACEACLPGQVQNPNGSTLPCTRLCQGNNVMTTFTEGQLTIPYCMTCPDGTQSTDGNSRCVPVVCSLRDLGFSSSATIWMEQSINDATCVNRGSYGAMWTMNCTPDQRFELDKCYFCPPGSFGGERGGPETCRPSTNARRTAPQGSLISATCDAVVVNASDADRPGQGVWVEVYRDGPRTGDWSTPGGTLVGGAWSNGGSAYVPIYLPASSTATTHRLYTYALDDQFRGWTQRLGEVYGNYVTCQGQPWGSSDWSSSPPPAPQSCAVGQFLSGSTCFVCPAGTTSEGGAATSCTALPSAPSAPSAVPDGYELHWNGVTFVWCGSESARTYSNAATGHRCTACPTGMKPDAARASCVACAPGECSGLY
jgi:hypothetical protein